MFDRVRRWASKSLGLWIVLIVVVSGFLTNWASAHGWRAGWNNPSRTGHFDFLFLVPAAMLWGFGCGIFLAKGWPRNFLSKDELDDNAESNDAFIFWLGWIAFGLFLIFPILGVAYLFNLLGQSSY